LRPLELSIVSVNLGQQQSRLDPVRTQIDRLAQHVDRHIDVTGRTVEARLIEQQIRLVRIKPVVEGVAVDLSIEGICGVCKRRFDHSTLRWVSPHPGKAAIERAEVFAHDQRCVRSLMSGRARQYRKTPQRLAD
jgi:hypothetical protein